MEEGKKKKQNDTYMSWLKNRVASSNLLRFALRTVICRSPLCYMTEHLRMRPSDSNMT